MGVHTWHSRHAGRDAGGTRQAAAAVVAAGGAGTHRHGRYGHDLGRECDGLEQQHSSRAQAAWQSSVQDAAWQAGSISSTETWPSAAASLLLA